MLESTIQKKIKDAITKKYGALVYKVNADSTRGLPDLLCVLPLGIVVFIEVKTDIGKVSALQARAIRQLKENGANAFVCRSLAEAINQIENIIGDKQCYI